MNDQSNHNSEAMSPRPNATFHSGSNGRTNGHAHGAHSANGHSTKGFDMWTVADILAQRWHWLVIGAILGCGALFIFAWYFVTPKYLATVQLLRYQTSGTGDFLKGEPMSAETFSDLIAAPDLLRRVGSQMDPQIPADKLSKLLKVDPQPESDMVKVYLAATTPLEAVKLANVYGDEAVDYTRELQGKQAAQVANTYLKQQISQMDQDITALINQFRGVPASAPATNKLAQIGSELNSIGQNPIPSPEQTFMITKLNERLQSALADLSELTMKYQDAHPLVQAKTNQIAALKDEIRKMTGGDSAHSAAVIQPNGQIIQPDVEVIRTKLRALEDSRVALENRFREAEMFAANPPGIVRVFAPADLKTTKSSHRRLKIGVCSIVGGVLGMGASLLLLCLVEFTDRRVRTTDDIRRVTKLQVLSTLGDLNHMHEITRTQWAFRTWTMLQGRLSRSQHHGLVCGVTSSTEGEGRSTWIQMLAEAASLAGFKVLTIATRPSPTEDSDAPDELNGERLEQLKDAPDMNTKSETNHSSALTAANVLSAPAQVADQLTGPNARPVVHIPLPGWVWNLERRKQWRDALNHWKKIDNLVIFVELPPASVPEAVLLGSNLPNLVWLADSGSADAGETREQVETLRNARCNLVGAVLNHEPARHIKSHFPRWFSCLAVLAALTLNVHAQTSTAITAQPSAPDTNATLLSDQPLPAPPLTNAVNANLSFSVVNPAQRAAWTRNLTLGPGDVVSISLYGDTTQARTEVPVGPDGRISFLEAQDVLVSGLTVDGLRQRLDDVLGKYRRAPRSIVTPVSYRSKRYYVLGKVVQRGVYVLDRPITVIEALARAKGIESGQVDYDIVDVADLQRAFLMRNSKPVQIDFEKLFEHGDLTQNVQIEPGDYLYFPSADVKQIYVLGEVALPGSVTYRPDMSVLAAISARGGWNEKAYKSHVLVLRGSIHHPQTFVVDMMGITSGRLTDFKLEPKDIIYVSWRPFYRGEELLDLAATAFVQSVVAGLVGRDVLPLK